MGTTYTYLCPKCGFKNSYTTRGSFFTDEYYRETEALEKKLRKEIEEGVHGDFLKRLLNTEIANDLGISCHDRLFHCLRCSNLQVAREKCIYHSEIGHTLEVNITQTCPICKKDTFVKVGTDRPMCPKCGESYMNCISLAKGD